MAFPPKSKASFSRRNRIVSALMERVAFADAFDGKPSALEESKPLDCRQRVLRTGWGKPARRRQIGRNEFSIKFNRINQQVLHWITPKALSCLFMTGRMSVVLHKGSFHGRQKSRPRFFHRRAQQPVGFFDHPACPVSPDRLAHFFADRDADAGPARPVLHT